MAKLSLFNRVSSYLTDVKSAISDQEFILLNRRDFHISQVSAVNATLSTLQVNVGYPYRVLLALLDQHAAATRGDFNIILGDPSLTIAAFQVHLRAGGNANRGKVFARRGIANLPKYDGFIGRKVVEFNQSVSAESDAKPSDSRADLYTFVLGNTKSPEQTIYAVEAFSQCRHGLLILKDYTRVDAADERQFLEERGIFPAMTFEGHAIALK